MQFWVVQTKLLELISTKKRLTKPLIAVVHVAENKESCDCFSLSFQRSHM